MVLYSLRFLVIVPALIVCFHNGARAEQLDAEVPDTAEGVQEPGLESIHSKLDEIKADTSLDEATRTRLTDLYESALKQLKTEEGYRKETDGYRASALQAAKEIEDTHKQLNLTVEASKKNIPDESQDIPSEQLDSQLFETRLRLESLKNNLEQLGRNLKQQQSRPGQIRLDQRQIQDKLRELDAQQQSIPASGNGTHKAQLTAIHATEKALRANLNSLQMELSSHPPRQQLLRARYDLAIAKVATESARLESLEKLAVANRESEAARYSKELAEALQAASDKHPLIREMIQQNFELGKEFRILSEEFGVAAARLNEIKEETKRIENESEDSEKKVSLAGLSPTLAAILREQRRLLPGQARIDRIAERLVAKTGEVSLRLFEIEEKQRSFLDIDRTVEEKLASSNKNEELSKHQLMRVRVELNLLLDEQKSLLVKLNETYSKYLNILGDIDFSKQRLSEVARGYAAFLDENLLWVKSSPPINEKFFWNLARAARWIVSPEQWWETGARLMEAFESRKLLVLLSSAVILAILGARRAIAARLDEISELVGSVRTDRFRYTLDAIGFTILRVAPGIAALYGVGWLLDSNINTPEFARAVGRGLCAASLPLFLLQIFYRIFSPGGIAELHLKWRQKSVANLRSQAGWLRFVVVPCVFMITLTGSQSEVEYSDSLGRLALIVAMIAMSLALGKALHPSRGALKYFLADHYTAPIARMRFIWYGLILLVPLVIAGFAAAGYLASAIELQEKLVATIRVAFIAIIVHQSALRG
ncbi:MAG: hypothetical protein L0Y38_05980, partial [Methylococcaceae bacterium]|nr:hypothetical protein [Methylococcaceae bacterium]